MNTKIAVYILVIIVIVLGAVYFFRSSQNVSVPSAASPSANTVTPAVTSAVGAVSIINFSFNPGTVTINKGDTVVWTNNDSVSHQIARDDGNLNGPVMSKGQSYTLVFNTAGTFTYHCAIHPSMKGTIVVQ